MVEWYISQLRTTPERSFTLYFQIPGIPAAIKMICRHYCFFILDIYLHTVIFATPASICILSRGSSSILQAHKHAVLLTGEVNSPWREEGLPWTVWSELCTRLPPRTGGKVRMQQWGGQHSPVSANDRSRVRRVPVQCMQACSPLLPVQYIGQPS